MAERIQRMHKIGCMSGVIFFGLTLYSLSVLDMWTWAVSLLVAGIATPFVMWRWSNWRARRRNPKDYGYSVYERAERLAEIFPHQSATTIGNWIADYEEVNRLVWGLAAAGGSDFIPKEQVRSLLIRAFPWLDGPGLNTAASRVDYNAWHEGFHVTPEATLPEVIAMVEGFERSRME